MTKVYDFDVVILGGGPAGLSAAIYAARGNVSTAVIDINPFGGQPSNYAALENYPGSINTDGFELMEKFEEQADLFGVQKFPMQEILSVDLISENKVILTTEARFNAKTVIIATGAQAKKLGVKGEKEFTGCGVSYCAVCDGAFYKDKIVTVVGGGNSAVEEAMYLARFASKVFIVHRRNELRADKILQERLKIFANIELIYNSTVKEIVGEDKVTKVILNNTQNNNLSELETDGVFPYIGMVPNVEKIAGQVKQDAMGFIFTDATLKTSVEGVYAAGDVRVTPLRQVITAAADGAVSAVYAVKYLEQGKYTTPLPMQIEQL